MKDVGSGCRINSKVKGDVKNGYGNDDSSRSWGVSRGSALDYHNASARQGDRISAADRQAKQPEEWG
jgi:hypothetical protein